MKHSITIWTSLIALTLFACSSKENNTEVETEITEEQITVPSLADSLIPESVKTLTVLLEKKGIKILTISSSKWSLFGDQGIWLKTEKGVVDIVPIPKHIDRTKIKVSEVDSGTPDFYIYEIRYKGELEQSLQGHQTYFTVGKTLIYKTFNKTLNDEIMKVEFKELN